jgi:hypothetical protein
MSLRHPLDFLPPGLRLRLFFLFLALTAAGFAVFQLLDQPLRNPAAPAGTVSFELAGTVEKAQAMVAAWDAPARLNSAFGLGFDFLFMPVYATALSLAVLLAKDRRRRRWLPLGQLLGWGAFAATVFDTVENLALFASLRGGAAAPYPQIAAGCAVVKFTLILLGMLYGLAGWWLPEKQK